MSSNIYIYIYIYVCVCVHINHNNLINGILNKKQDINIYISSLGYWKMQLYD